MIVKMSGFIEQQAQEGTEIPSLLEREALLVYCGNFDSMDGMVEIKEEHIQKLHDNHNSMLATVARMMSGAVPIKNNPPVQVDHSTSGWDTVGRLVGDVRIGEHSLAENNTVKALYGRVRVLGKENVERVLDGRWTHLSIGADLEDGKFQELTITPFPAAKDASMLSRMAKSKSEKYNGKTISVESGPGVSWYVVVDDLRRGPFQREEDAWEAAKQIVDSGVLNKLSGGDTMFEKLKAFLMRTKKLSEKDAEQEMKKMGEEEKKHLEMAEGQREKMKKHLMDEKKMSAEDAEKHLGEMNIEDHKKLAAEVDEHDKKMAAEDAKKAEDEKDMKDKKMSAKKEELTKLASGFNANVANARLAMKKTKITARLSALQSRMKITPAEVKKIDLVKLSAESDATIDAVLKSYENREAVIITGMVGSAKAVDISQVQKQSRLNQLEAETRANMPLLAKTAGQKLKQGNEPSTVQLKENSEKESTVGLEEIHKEAEKHMQKAHMALDAGNNGEAKEHMRKMLEHYKAHMGAHHMSEPEHKVDTEMSALAESVEKMQNDVSEIIKLAETFSS